MKSSRTFRAVRPIRSTSLGLASAFTPNAANAQAVFVKSRGLNSATRSLLMAPIAVFSMLSSLNPSKPKAHTIMVSCCEEKLSSSSRRWATNAAESASKSRFFLHPSFENDHARLATSWGLSDAAKGCSSASTASATASMSFGWSVPSFAYAIEAFASCRGVASVARSPKALATVSAQSAGQRPLPNAAADHATMDSSCVFMRGARFAAALASAPARSSPPAAPILAHAHDMLATCWGSSRCASIHRIVILDASASAASRAVLSTGPGIVRPPPSPSPSPAVSLASAWRMLATSWGLKSSARDVTAEHTSPNTFPYLNPSPVVDTPSPCVTSASSLARDMATLLTPCDVHSTLTPRQPPGPPPLGSRRGPLGAAGALGKDTAMASAMAWTSSDRDGSSPSFAAPQTALASSCGLNLDACITAAASMPLTRSAARLPSSSLPHAHSMLASCLDSTCRGSLRTSAAAASSNRANCSWRTLGTPGRVDAVGDRWRWVSGHLASLWSAVPQFTRLNSSTESLTIARTSAARVLRASSWFSWTCRPDIAPAAEN